MATHRKVHLFDIDIPGKITFKVPNSSLTICVPGSHQVVQESETLTGGQTLNYFDTGTDVPVTQSCIGISDKHLKDLHVLALVFAMMSAFRNLR